MSFACKSKIIELNIGIRFDVIGQFPPVKFYPCTQEIDLFLVKIFKRTHNTNMHKQLLQNFQ